MTKDAENHRSFIAHPFFMGLFLFFWLSLNGWTVGNFIFGGLVSFFMGHLLEHFGLRTIRLRRPCLFLKLLFYVIKDSIKGHIQVIVKLFHPKKEEHFSGVNFVTIPLKLYHPTALALLNSFICLSPGAIWVSYNMKEHTILVHLLDRQQEAVFVHNFNHIYQALLAKIFIEQE